MINTLLSRLGIEVWKDIPDFEDYQVSNLGRIRSLKFNKVKYLKQCHISSNSTGRYSVTLSQNGKKFNRCISVLVAMSFLNHKPGGFKLVVDHIDNNSLNDRLYNLQVITQRKNCSKDKKGSSKYTGVSWRKRTNKWKASISINNKSKHIGLFKNELEAANAYKKALEEYERSK